MDVSLLRHLEPRLGGFKSKRTIRPLPLSRPVKKDAKSENMNNKIKTGKFILFVFILLGFTCWPWKSCSGCKRRRLHKQNVEYWRMLSLA